MEVDERPSIVVKHEPNAAQNDEAQPAYQENLEEALKQGVSHSNPSIMIMQQHLQHVPVTTSTTNQHSINPIVQAASIANPQQSPSFVLPGSAATGYVHVPTLNQQDTQGCEADEFDDDIHIRDKEELREQDRFLPIANVARIMKRAIPDNGKIAKDAKECVQECVSEFISFITSEASERCQQEKRKTINGEDILFAMTTLGFDNYVEPLKVYLTKYRESMKGEKILSMNEYGAVEVDENTLSHNIQYQVGNSLHPTMVANNGTFQYTQAQVAQLQQQNLHFNP